MRDRETHLENDGGLAMSGPRRQFRRGLVRLSLGVALIALVAGCSGSVTSTVTSAPATVPVTAPTSNVASTTPLPAGAGSTATPPTTSTPTATPTSGPTATTGISHLGIFTPRVTNGTIRTSPIEMMAEMKALGVDTVRVEQDITQPLAQDVAAYVKAGFKINLTLRNDPQLGDQGKPTVVPPHTPQDLATFRSNLSRTLDAVHPVLLAVENEEVGSPFVSGTADDYLAELAAAIEVGHAHGVAVTNGGITSGTLPLLTWQDLHDRGLDAEADDYVRTVFAKSTGTGKQKQLLDDLLAKPFVGIGDQRRSEALAKGLQLVAAYRTMPMDYVNFHWYVDDDSVLRQSVEYLRRATGHEVVTHEIGQYSIDPTVVTGHLKTLADLGVPFVMWFDADGDPALGLHDQPGVLRPNGNAFAAAAPSVTRPV